LEHAKNLFAISGHFFEVVFPRKPAISIIDGSSSASSCCTCRHGLLPDLVIAGTTGSANGKDGNVEVAMNDAFPTASIRDRGCAK
jgi:hypothetical protein